MKFGVRKPSVKKSIKARTTGRAKRAVKKAVTPGYGKKGVGLIKNPKKSVYNRVYKKTSVDAFESIKSDYSETYGQDLPAVRLDYSKMLGNISGILIAVFGVILFFGSAVPKLFAGNLGLGLWQTILSALIVIGGMWLVKRSWHRTQ